jgi:hypothetical protein
MAAWRIVGELQSVETIAQGRGIRELRRLKKIYGGKNWRKRTGVGHIAFGATGKVIPAEIHWYEAHGVGRVEWKIKRLL